MVVACAAALVGLRRGSGRKCRRGVRGLAVRLGLRAPTTLPADAVLGVGPSVPLWLLAAGADIEMATLESRAAEAATMTRRTVSS